jgi:hypothetical protein
MAHVLNIESPETPMKAISNFYKCYKYGRCPLYIRKYQKIPGMSIKDICWEYLCIYVTIDERIL